MSPMSNPAEPAVSKAVVGPLPTIHFGPPRHRVRLAYTVPRNTLDVRHALCTDHHPACDCREAELNERLDEFLHMSEALRKAATTVLCGHRLYDHGDDRRRAMVVGGDEWWQLIRGNGPLACQCTGCQLIRASEEHVHTNWNGVVECPDPPTKKGLAQ